MHGHEHELLNFGCWGTAGRQWFLRSALITSLTDEIINRTVLAFANTPIGCSTCFVLDLRKLSLTALV